MTETLALSYTLWYFKACNGAALAETDLVGDFVIQAPPVDKRDSGGLQGPGMKGHKVSEVLVLVSIHN